jgi:ABC-type antimicrobial peptide transport system permease subunit
MSADKHPPILAQRLLKWHAGKADLEDIQGDLDEVYGLTLEQSGKLKADIIYWVQVLSLLFSYGLKKRKSKAAYSSFYHKNSMTMFKNYLKISLRNLKKQRAFTLINVLGLSIGMSIALLAMAMYVELKQFDTYHPNAEDLYRVTTTVELEGDREKYSSSPPALTYRMDEVIPSIYKSVHIDESFTALIDHYGNNIRTYGYHTEPSFFDVFAFEMESGTPEVLNEPGKVIITKELATKLFGEQEALGKTLMTEEWGQLQVAGVLKAFPKRTHLRFDMITGFALSEKFDANYQTSIWTTFTHSYYYFAIEKGKAEEVQSRMNDIGKAGLIEFQNENTKATYNLQALLDITPGELLNDGIGIQFDMPTMLVFFGISLLILIPACFNYANMSIAIALKRSKEVGIRKVMGSHRKHIINQFLVETTLICLSSLLISAFIFNEIKIGFASMVAGGNALVFDTSPTLILVFIGFAVLTGILTGLGPALYFAKISPIQALRSATSKKVSISGLRKGLMVFQFTLTLGFMIGIGVLLKQYHESRSFQVPFTTEDTFMIYTQGMETELLKTELITDSRIEAVSFSSSIPGTSLYNQVYAHHPENQDSMRFKQVFVDDQFINHMNLELLWGEPLTTGANSPEKVVVNEEMIRRLKQMNFTDTLNIFLSGGHRAHVVGILENYNHEPLNESMEPMMLRIDPDQLTYCMVKLPMENKVAASNLLAKHWDQLFPNVPFKATLLETEIDNAYHFFRVGIQIFGFLAILAISISCLGLLGMVIYATENRTKEVAIRKTLGATKRNLYGSLAGLFLKLWAIALLIAIPASYLFYDNVLVSIFNKYGDGVGVLEIFLSISVTLLLGGAAIYWQVNKITRINPATNLRND